VALDIDAGGRGFDVPSVIPTQIYGFDSMRRLRELCIFSRLVKADPASVTAMKLDVDKAEWERPFNRLPALPSRARTRRKFQSSYLRCWTSV
jgi:hypothetical protein